jgi:hypothetical protein
MAAKKPKNETEAKSKRWSQHVTQTSFALDLEQGVFTWDDPRRIAESLKESAERSKARKTTPFHSPLASKDRSTSGTPGRTGRRISHPA